MALVLNPMDDLLFKVDLKKEIARHAAKPAKYLAMAPLKAGKSNVSFEVEGEICTAGISCTNFGSDKKQKLSYSIGLAVEAEETFEPLFEKLKETCVTEEGEDEWDITEPLKDGKLYLKLKLDGTGKKFAFKSNVPLTPKKFAEASNRTNLKVEGSVSAWFNLADKKAGLLFTPKHLTFNDDSDEEEDESEMPPPAKKRKTSPPASS
jgi:hypothetical protein